MGLLHHTFWLQLVFGAFWALLFNFWNYCVWQRITGEGSVPEIKLNPIKNGVYIWVEVSFYMSDRRGHDLFPLNCRFSVGLPFTLCHQTGFEKNRSTNKRNLYHLVYVIFSVLAFGNIRVFLDRIGLSVA